MLWQGLLLSVVGVSVGVVGALFLFLLDGATRLRIAHPVLIFALPVLAYVVGWLYERFGQQIKAGNNLVIETAQQTTAQHHAEIPVRMAPLVILGTVLSHLGGASVGREGTAVQLGASIADWLAHRGKRLWQAWYPLPHIPHRRQLIIAMGTAAGFSAVFGTPISATVFALEFLVVGRIDTYLILPVILSAWVAHTTSQRITHILGIAHTEFPQVAATPLDAVLLLKWTGLALLLALTTRGFVFILQMIKKYSTQKIPASPWRMAMGGVLVVLLWQILQTDVYLGLGVNTIVQALHDPTLPLYTWAGKFLFTVVSLGAGMIGGEVTPLFYMGASLGNAYAQIVDTPITLTAAVGMTALFATAANVPIALSLMAVELFGGHILPHVVIVSAMAYVSVGHCSIYAAQRLHHNKMGIPIMDIHQIGIPIHEVDAVMAEIAHTEKNTAQTAHDDEITKITA